MFLRKDDFFAWLDEYTRTKRNDLQRSQVAIPKRSEKIILNLSVIPLQPIEVNIPFKSVTYVEAYNSLGIRYEAPIELILDSASTGNRKNSTRLSVYDTFNQDQTISKCFITWTSTYPGVFAELAFFEDSQLYSGSSKSQIVSSIPISVLQGSSPWRTSEPPLRTESFDVIAGGIQNWTVPDGEYWHLNVSVHVPGVALTHNQIFLNGTLIAWPQEKGFYAWEWDSLAAQDLITIQSDLGGSGIQGFFAKFGV